MKDLILAFLRPATVFPVPTGIVADNSGAWGLFGLMANVNTAMANGAPTTVTSSATAVTLTAAQLLAGNLLRAGAPGGGVADTTPTATQIITQMGPTVPTDSSFGVCTRIQNATGQTITVTAGTGVTLTGTMTIANGSYRDLIIVPTGAAAVTITNLGGGSV